MFPETLQRSGRKSSGATGSSKLSWVTLLWEISSPSTITPNTQSDAVLFVYNE